MAGALERREIVKVLLLGETGSGKTRFVDLLKNYSEQYDKEFELENMKVFTICKTSNDMESDTVEVQRYLCHFDKYSIELIDTPGFADNRREEQERENKMKIFEFIKNEKNINCLCLLFNGRINRLNESLQKTVIDLVRLLPSVVMENTVILFTQVTGNLQVNRMLKKLIKEKIQLSLSKQIYFTIDNPFSILKQWKEDQKEDQWEEDYHDESQTKEIQKLFEECFKNELANFCKTVKAIGTINSDSITSFHELKDEIDLKIHKICSITEQKQNELVHPEHDVLSMHTELTELHNTICTICFSNCHSPCSYSGFWLPSAKYCKVFNFRDHCSECKHHFHFHKRRKFCYTTERVPYDKNSRTKPTISVDKSQEAQMLELRKQLLLLLADYHRKSNRSYQERLVEEIKLSHLQRVPPECITKQEEICKEAEKIDALIFSTKTTFQEKVEWALKFVGLNSVKSPEEVELHITKISPNCCITTTKKEDCSKLFKYAQSIFKDVYHREAPLESKNE